MKKIGLITIIDYTNYGNRLQNYATQRVLESLGFNVTTIVNEQKKQVNKNDHRSLYDRLSDKNLKELVTIIIKKANKKKHIFATNKRMESLKKFTKDNIKESNYILKIESIPNNIGELYDYFIVGSDQVWNPIYRKGSPIDFLTFAPSKKRIAYAASFGISDIPSEYKENYTRWLSEFAHLSVREEAGAKIIKDLTNIDTDVLIDPTLMLSREEWITISKPSRLKPEKRFLLTYFLGEVSKETKDLIKLISKKYKYEVVNVGSYKDIDRYATDPSEFIDYINSSCIFLTDSFHGVVFSILLEKPFIVFDRISKVPSMNSRIDTLLSKFNLEDRKWENIKKSQEYFNCDFTHIQTILEHERNKAYKYLKNALDVKDEVII